MEYKLIEFVKNNPVLYEKQYRTVKYLEEKQAKWEEISRIIRKDRKLSLFLRINLIFKVTLPWFRFIYLSNFCAIKMEVLKGYLLTFLQTKNEKRR